MEKIKTQRYALDSLGNKIHEGDIVVYQHVPYRIRTFFFYNVALKAAENMYLTLVAVNNPNKLVEWVKPQDVWKATGTSRERGPYVLK